METIKDLDLKEKVLEEKSPVLLYFYSPLQVPCLLVEAPLENLEKEYEGRVRFYKMNISEGVDTCLKYGVLSVPKMLIFKDGHVVAQRVGSASSAVLASFIKASIYNHGSGINMSVICAFIFRYVNR